uniref:BEL1-like homeodomain protein 1 n=1 Tax=Erigeron canadensis TaxID=72917 RepID=UPI001CB90720|nr:BEL1-like homeodomain protein 1 [Erigeron canadensis]
MATYYNGNTNSEIQSGDGLQTLVLMNPGYVYYPESSQQQQQQQSGNFVFLDHSNHPGNNNNNNNNNNHQHQQQHGNNSMSHAPSSAQQTQQFVGIPLSASPPSSVHSQHDVSSLHAFIPRAHQYMYTPVEMVPAAQPHQREVTPFQQGLSLSLSSQQSRFGSQAAARLPISPTGDQDGRAAVGGGSTSSASGISNSVNGMHNMLLNSKYLKATQEILEQVVNVGKVALKNSDPSIKDLKGVGSGDDDGSPLLITGEGTSRDEAATKSGGGPELTTAERQEIQMKKAKLVNMLDEVEQRYRQYHHQMQIVISWFEQAAGIGSAKTYTALALQTISKQFRCLKDAIMGQIKAASRSLGEEDSLGGGKTEGSGSRLKFVDNQLRQQRALQQLGMMQHNAWRPQRGLPERSVSVLRAWLFEHFLHPYPKDSDKHMLAKQTGLTRSQVSNWFINARVRLWKPMVEEMYLEEIKEQEQNGMEDPKSGKNEENQEHSASKGEKSLSPENSNRGYRATKQENSFHAAPPMTVSTSVSTSPNATGINLQNPSGFSLLGSLEMEGITQFSPKKPRNDGRQQQNQNEGGGFTLTGSNPTDFMGGLGGYPIGEIGRFTTDQFQQQYSGNGVSLTLGLPHCENLSISGSHQSFLPNQSIQLSRGAELGEENDYGAMNPPSSSHSAAMYDSMNIQNRKRFAAQPLPDFVA